MHTDEYEISLLREVGVCNGTIRTLKNTLERFEQRYSLTSDEVANGKVAAARVDEKERTRWLETYQALKSWQQRKTEFEDLYHQLKIASPTPRPS